MSSDIGTAKSGSGDQPVDTNDEGRAYGKIDRFGSDDDLNEQTGDSDPESLGSMLMSIRNSATDLEIENASKAYAKRDRLKKANKLALLIAVLAILSATLYTVHTAILFVVIYAWSGCDIKSAGWKVVTVVAFELLSFCLLILIFIIYKCQSLGICRKR